MAHKTLNMLSLFALTMAVALIAAAAVSFPASAHNGKDVAVNTGTSVQIGTNGNALVRGAEVTALSGGVITARTDWGDTAITWSVDTDTADFVTKNGNDSSYAEVDVGDEISFSGVLANGSFAVDATAVRNWSLVDDSDDDDNDHDKTSKGNFWGFWKGISDRFHFSSR